MPATCSHDIAPSPGSRESGLRRALCMPRPLDAQTACPRWFRHLLSAAASAFQPAGLRLVRTSNARRQSFSTGSALRRATAVLRPPAVSALSGQCLGRADRPIPLTMASADFCQTVKTPCSASSLAAARQISQGKTRDFPSIRPPHLRRRRSG
jgi:hypothetical protein